ncbi:hypothetical protein ACQP00_20195 [Dactylosporangium sp. CS-047395]|uniref:hypothetical protein n=1 Tax=Dactylosporangium sp. CS-047395 TaxID=3239936 RepID=UPI003D9298D9
MFRRRRSDAAAGDTESCRHRLLVRLQCTGYLCHQSGGYDCFNLSTGTAAKSRTGTLVNPLFDNRAVQGMFQFVVNITDSTTHTHQSGPSTAASTRSRSTTPSN